MTKKELSKYTLQVLNPQGEIIYTNDFTVDEKLKIKFWPGGRVLKEIIKRTRAIEKYRKSLMRLTGCRKEAQEND